VTKPLIALAADVRQDKRGVVRHQLKASYVDAVVAAGGVPVVLPASPVVDDDALDRFDGFILTGGADADVRTFGVADLHPSVALVRPERHAATLRLLDFLSRRRAAPALGICLGMQYMALHAGGALHQHLGDDDVLGPERASLHRDDRVHRVRGDFGPAGFGVFDGPVTSEHHQGVAKPGSLEVCGRADDGVIEALRDPARPFYVGVQWHPERTTDARLGVGVLRALVEACARRRS
jgi:putative glutamine amidotransferase